MALSTRSLWGQREGFAQPVGALRALTCCSSPENTVTTLVSFFMSHLLQTLVLASMGREDPEFPSVCSWKAALLDFEPQIHQ